MTVISVSSNGPRYIAKTSDITWDGSGSRVPGTNLGSFVFFTDNQKEYIVDESGYIVYYLTRTTGS